MRITRRGRHPPALVTHAGSPSASIRRSVEPPVDPTYHLVTWSPGHLVTCRTGSHQNAKNLKKRPHRVRAPDRVPEGGSDEVSRPGETPRSAPRAAPAAPRRTRRHRPGRAAAPA